MIQVLLPEMSSASLVAAELRCRTCLIAKHWHAGRFEELPLSAYQDIMTVNYMGAVHATKAVLPSMLQQGTGHLVYVSSSMGLIGLKQCPHNTMKAGMLARANRDQGMASCRLCGLHSIRTIQVCPERVGRLFKE